MSIKLLDRARLIDFVFAERYISAFEWKKFTNLVKGSQAAGWTAA